MDVSHLLDELNEPQREAVASNNEHVLVLAGAGSGKTRVLIHRLAWLIQVQHVSPLGVLAVTFTNKAAGEMRQRASQLLQVSTRPLWIGTFHGIAHRLLRMHWKEAGLPDGVINLVTCGREQAEILLKHPDIKGVTFVGSTSVGRHIYKTAAGHDKRVQALCEAKNHALVLKDCKSSA